MMQLWFLFVVSALAQDADESLTVKAQRSVEAARIALDLAIREEGYMSPIEIGQRSHYLHPRIFKPRITVSDEGLLMVRSRAATPMMWLPAGTRAQNPDAGLPLTLSDDMKLQNPQLSGLHMITANRANRRQMKSQALYFAEEVNTWRQALWERNRALREEEIHERLFTVWADDDRSWPERRTEILSMWRNTADTVEGGQVRALIEIFIDEVIQTSAHPLTTAEIGFANQARGFEERLQPLSPTQN